MTAALYHKLVFAFLRSLATVTKHVPKGAVCFVSALVLQGLTDQLPKKVWLAVGQKDWTPKRDGTPIRIVCFTDALLAEAVEIHVVEDVPVKVFGIVKTVADYFRYHHKIGACVLETERNTLPREVEHLRSYDTAKSRIQVFLQMPESQFDLMLEFLRQNDGRFSKRACETEFAALTDEEVLVIKGIYADLLLPLG